MVTVTSNAQPGSRVQLDIEVAADEVSRHFATAYRHVAERTRVPGFRPGKAPRHVIDRFVGRGSIIAEAIEHLVGESYDAALDQTTIVPIDQPQVVSVQVRLRPGASMADVHGPIGKLIAAELGRIPELCMELAQGRHSVC